MPPFPESPDRDELQVLGDYIYAYQRHLLTPLELQVDGVYRLLFKSISSDNEQILRRGLKPLEPPFEDPVTAQALEHLVGTHEPDWGDVDMNLAWQRWCRTIRDAAVRISRDESSGLKVARCPSCDRVLNTPRARQCFVCGEDWHG